MSPQTLFAALLLAQAGAKTVWLPSDTLDNTKERARRLNNFVTSTVNTSDPGCIVGGYDNGPTDPPVVHVGGPCSAFGANNQPGDGFRWLSMLTIGADFADNNGPTGTYTKLHEVPGQAKLQSQVIPNSHAEVGTLGIFHFNIPQGQSGAGARLFASQTSYLAQSTLSFNAVDFVTGEKDGVYDKLNICTESCGTPPATCSGQCPSTQTTAVPGDFKYSILAAAYNDASIAGGGWDEIVKAYGTGEGDAKQLTGVFNVYQYVDFTNMGADNMTMATSGGATTLFANMDACNGASIGLCTWYDVTGGISLAAAGWEGVHFTFPATYNRGDWTCNDQACKNPTTAPGDTKSVVIQAVKPDNLWLLTLGMTSTNKIILLRYTFDVTGITASASAGKWMVYDPSVQTASAAAAASNSGAGSGSSGSGSGGSGGGTGTTSGSVSNSCFAALSMAVWFMAAKM